MTNPRNSDNHCQIARTTLKTSRLLDFASHKELIAQIGHVHVVVGATRHDVGEVVKCAKEAVRYGLRLGRPIWSGNYDKRFCFDGVTLRKRVRYVERHNEAIGWPVRPWAFITPVEQYLSGGQRAMAAPGDSPGAK